MLLVKSICLTLNSRISYAFTAICRNENDTILNTYIYTGHNNTSFLLSRRYRYYTAADKTLQKQK